MSTLSQMRRSRGMTQAALAAKIGVSRSLIGLVEGGYYKPYPKLVRALCDEFNVPPTVMFPELFGDE